LLEEKQGDVDRIFLFYLKNRGFELSFYLERPWEAYTVYSTQFTFSLAFHSLVSQKKNYMKRSRDASMQNGDTGSVFKEKI